MGRGRLEAFSDGVLAIVLTVMVLELKIPRGADLAALRPVLPVFLSYVLSFVMIGIYWNNHHHLLQATARVNGRILWANLHLLFWLSLIPVTTAWVGASPRAHWPTALYGLIFLFAGFAYNVLERSIVKHDGRESVLARAIAEDRKGLVSLLLYAAAMGLAFVHPFIADALYVAVAVMWLVPDPRIERAMGKGSP